MDAETMAVQTQDHSHGHEADGGPGAVPSRLAHGSLPETRVFGFWVFLAGEATLFASLIGTFLALHGQVASGPTSQELFDLPLVFVATMALLTSSLTGALATRQLQLGNLRGMQAWLAVTIVLGEIFLGIQAYEFYNYIANEGFGLSTSAFSSAFYALVGFHGMHVSFGVFWLISHLFNSFLKRGVTQADASKIFVAGLYWHFVDVVWVLIFSIVYLMGKMAV